MIQFQHLSFGYHSRQLLFDHLDLDLKPGRIHGLLGKNGTGKTTLLKLVCGLVFPTGGNVTVDDFIPGKRSPEFLSQLFLLPEEIYLQASTPGKLADLYAPFYPAFNLQQYKELMQELDVEFNQKLTRMSLGQKKKALIAFALACNTRYLLLDEPTNGLDIPSKVVFRRLIASVFDEERTILISTHQVRDLDSLIDNVIILNQNDIKLNATVEDIATHFHFGHGNTPPADALYACPGVLGQSYLQPNQGTPGLVDLETLFNAVTAQPSLFNALNRK